MENLLKSKLFFSNIFSKIMPMGSYNYKKHISILLKDIIVHFATGCPPFSFSYSNSTIISQVVADLSSCFFNSSSPVSCY